MYALLENKRKEMEKGGFTHLANGTSIHHQSNSKKGVSIFKVGIFIPVHKLL